MRPIIQTGKSLTLRISYLLLSWMFKWGAAGGSLFQLLAPTLAHCTRWNGVGLAAALGLAPSHIQVSSGAAAGKGASAAELLVTGFIQRRSSGLISGGAGSDDLGRLVECGYHFSQLGYLVGQEDAANTTRLGRGGKWGHFWLVVTAGVVANSWLL